MLVPAVRLWTPASTGGNRDCLVRQGRYRPYPILAVVGTDAKVADVPGFVPMAFTPPGKLYTKFAGI